MERWMKNPVVNIGAKLNLWLLIESRLLIQASSGGGKSYMLRVLAEQTLPHMPVIILDWEGEFASLREKFDVVLAGPGGDAPCDVKSAKLTQDAPAPGVHQGIP
jgi:DNA helicase HerA-like ATPase